MPVFEYTALDSRGKQLKGSIDADSARSARQRLRGQGVVPITLKEGLNRGSKLEKREVGVSTSAVNPNTPVVPKLIGDGGTFSGKPHSLSTPSAASASQPQRPEKRFSELSSLVRSIQNRVSAKTLALSTRQLATLLSAGIPLVETIQSLADQSSPVFRSALIDIRERVEEGSSFARALGSYPAIFPRLFVNMVASGEASGKLDTVVTSLAEYLETQLELRRKLISALIYPTVMLIFCLLVVSGLLAFVVPQIVEIFTKQGAVLPMPTRIMIAISDMLVYYWYLIGAIIALLAYSLFKFYLSSKGRSIADRALIKMPVIGQLYVKVLTARITRTLSTLLASGVGLLESLEMSKNVVGNVHFRDAMRAAREGVTEGRSLSRELARSGLFPPVVCQMIGVGERSGRLEEMLATAGTTYEKDAAASIAGLTSLVEPLMIIVLGGVVLLIVVSILLPLTDLMDLVAM